MKKLLLTLISFVSLAAQGAAGWDLYYQAYSMSDTNSLFQSGDLTINPQANYNNVWTNTFLLVQHTNNGDAASVVSHTVNLYLPNPADQRSASDEQKLALRAFIIGTGSSGDYAVTNSYFWNGGTSPYPASDVAGLTFDVPIGAATVRTLDFQQNQRKPHYEPLPGILGKTIGGYWDVSAFETGIPDSRYGVNFNVPLPVYTPPQKKLQWFTLPGTPDGSYASQGTLYADEWGDSSVTNTVPATNVFPYAWFDKFVFYTNAPGTATNVYSTNIICGVGLKYLSGDRTFVVPAERLDYSIASIFRGAPSGFTCNIWTNGGYVQSGYTSKGGWNNGTMQLPLGRGAIIHMPSIQTNTLAGYVPQGSFTNILTPGDWTLVGSRVPKAGWAQDLGLTPHVNDIASKMISGSWVNYTNFLPDFFQPLEWTGFDGVNCDQFLGPWLDIGDCIFYKNVSSNATWIQSFNP